MLFCPEHTQEERLSHGVGISVGVAGMVRRKADPKEYCIQDENFIQKRKEHQKKREEMKRVYTEEWRQHGG